MIQTKTEEERERKIRLELENITRELVKLNDDLDKIETKIVKLPYNKLEKLRPLSDEKWRIKSRIDYLEWRRNEFINLLNITN